MSEFNLHTERVGRTLVLGGDAQNPSLGSSERVD